MSDKKRTTLIMPKQLWEKIHAIAKSEEKTFSEIVVEALKAFVDP